jgi:hypothetical protein
MTLAADEFMRRFLRHVLPGGFHRIRHYGLIANAGRREKLARARELLVQPALDIPPKSQVTEVSAGSVRPTFVCPDCGAPMIIIETWTRRSSIIRAPP